MADLERTRYAALSEKVEDLRQHRETQQVVVQDGRTRQVVAMSRRFSLRRSKREEGGARAARDPGGARAAWWLGAAAGAAVLLVVWLRRGSCRGAGARTAVDAPPVLQLLQIHPYRNTTLPEFNAWIARQHHVSRERILRNIGDDSRDNRYGLPNGVVIASPSKEAPDYFYQWTRDAAITVNTLIDHLFEDADAASKEGLLGRAPNVTLASSILNWLNTSYVLQRTDNPSGARDSPRLSNLGEPKFEVNSTAFCHEWGRPQNDGPALRVIAIVHLLNKLHLHNSTLHDLIALVEHRHGNALHLPFHDEMSLWNHIVSRDLRFVQLNWQNTTFDLWEEINGYHFFTSMVQWFAVHEALEFKQNHTAEHFHFVYNENDEDLLTTSQKIQGFILSPVTGFMGEGKINHIVESPMHQNERSGYDIATILASLYSNPYSEVTRLDYKSKDQSPIHLNSTHIMNSLYGLIKHMSTIYPINKRDNFVGVGLGRYPEDIYDGYAVSEGNPWFLSTTGAAQYLYKLVDSYVSNGQDLSVLRDHEKEPFWELVFANFTSHRSEHQGEKYIIPFNSEAFNATMETIFRYADALLNKVKLHVNSDGDMSEQFNKYTGFLQGAEHLTWSYGAFMDCIKQRNFVTAKIPYLQRYKC